MTRTGERTTVTSEAVPDVALTLSAGRGYHGTALSQIAEALELRTDRSPWLLLRLRVILASASS